MPTKRVDQGRPTAVPPELGGKWVVWNAEHTCIVAHAETLQQLWQAAQEQQVEDPVFEKIPLSDVRFVGTR